MTSALSLLPQTKRGRWVLGVLALAGIVHALGALDARVGPLQPHFPGYGLLLGAFLAVALVPRTDGSVSHRTFFAAILFAAAAGVFLMRWKTGLAEVPSPLVASVRFSADAGARAEARVLVHELRLESRSSLRALTGRGQQVGVVVEGFIHVPSSGDHRFWVECDDHCALQIGEKRIGEGGGFFEATLPAGTQELRFDYYQESGPASFAVEWDRPALLELLPMQKLVSGRSELLTRASIRARTFGAALFLLSWSLWWVFVSTTLVRAGESRDELWQRLAAGWVALRDAPPLQPQDRCVTRADVAIVLGFLIFSLAFHSGHIGSQPPHVLLDDDAANIATFAAARDWPDLFVGDEILGNPRLARWYPTVHVPLIRAIAQITGDYGTAFVSLLGMHVLLQALGFYVLGRVLFRSRYWALLLAIATLMPVDLSLEFWGVYEHPIPRFSFQALVPFLAAAAYARGAEPRTWPAVMVAAGLLVYVHPVSAPAWGLALLLGLVPYLPRAWSWVRSFAVLVGLGVLFLVVAGPFVWHYLSNQAVGGGRASASYEDVQRIIEARFDAGYLELPQAFARFALTTTSRSGWFGWAWMVVGIMTVLGLRRRDRKGAFMALFWLLGIVVTSTLLPWIDHEIARANRGFPLQYDLVRGLRYLVPFVLLFSLWPLAEISLRLTSIPSSRLARTAPLILGGVLTAAWVYWNPPPISLASIGRCWSVGRFACGPTKAGAFEALEAIRERTPPGAAILPTNLPLAIRYYALRPVVHCYKDGGLLAYADHAELLKWNERKRALSRAMIVEDPAARLRILADLTTELGARYLFVEAAAVEGASSSGHRFVWANEEFALLEVVPSIE